VELPDFGHVSLLVNAPTPPVTLGSANFANLFPARQGLGADSHQICDFSNCQSFLHGNASFKSEPAEFVAAKLFFLPKNSLPSYRLTEAITVPFLTSISQ